MHPTTTLLLTFQPTSPPPPQLYPDASWLQSEYSSFPADGAVTIAFLVSGISVLFALFDWLSRRHGYGRLRVESVLGRARAAVENERMRARHAFVSMARARQRRP